VGTPLPHDSLAKCKYDSPGGVEHPDIPRSSPVRCCLLTSFHSASPAPASWH